MNKHATEEKDTKTKRGGKKREREGERRKKNRSKQTLTHCGKYWDQNQEADFHLGLAQSAKIKM